MLSVKTLEEWDEVNALVSEYALSHPEASETITDHGEAFYMLRWAFEAKEREKSLAQAS